MFIHCYYIFATYSFGGKLYSVKIAILLDSELSCVIRFDTKWCRLIVEQGFLRYLLLP